MLSLKFNALSPVRSVVVVLLLCVSFIASAFDAAVLVTEKSVKFSVDGSGAKFLSANIWAPSGEHIYSETSNGSSLTWSVNRSLDDGAYKYELRVSDITAGSRSRDAVSTVKPTLDSESGSFQVRSGSIVPINVEEAGIGSRLSQGLASLLESAVDIVIPTAKADILQEDDVISTFSHCIGSDCVNGETFSFDTLRLKENNLRIHFQDTSTSASFPSSDWRIVINDSNNGGANFFGIEDATAGRRVMSLEAGAPANSLFVDSIGRLGIGTSNPLTTIEAASGNTPTLRLNQNGTEGFTSYAWDFGGNEDGLFFRDVTNSLLPMRIAAGAPSNSFMVSSVGNIGLGIETPTEKLHVMGNAIISGNLELGSSRSIKHAIENLDLKQALTALVALEPVKYRYNHSPDQQTIGFIAEDVPDLVATESRKSLKPMDIVAVLTKVVQEQQKTIDEMSQKLDGLMSQTAAEENATDNN